MPTTAPTPTPMPMPTILRLATTTAALTLAALVVAAAPIQAAVPTVANEQPPPDDENCGLWLGPSSIKESEEHGWGHSIFTGKFIKKGTTVLGSGILDETKNAKVFGDLFIPLYDWEALDVAHYGRPSDARDDDFLLSVDKDNEKDNANSNANSNDKDQQGQQIQPDPPLYQELWNGDIYDSQVLESYESMRVFVPGLPVICPCAASGFNLEQVQTMFYRDWRNVKGQSHDGAPPSPQAGSFSYLSNAMFVAIRDILPGEELVVECVDNSDGFSPEEEEPSKFTPSSAGGYSICLDDKLEERLADHTINVATLADGYKDYGGQRGLFAKKDMPKGTVLTSTPMIPVHREEMTMDREMYRNLYEAAAELHGNYKKDGNNNVDGAFPHKKEQLLINYMYGHPESSLLWLPTAPLLHAANHANHDNKKLEPNARLQWHSDKYTEAQAAGKPLTRRQEFHHKELLEMDSLDVVRKHGMGLLVDLVATKPISENDEILIDYGKAWDDAMKQHKIDWASAVESIKKEHADEKANRKAFKKKERESDELVRRVSKDGNNNDNQQQQPHLHHRHRHRHIENSMTAIPLSSYVTASDFNDLHSHEPVRTVSEQIRNPYPSNLETACYFEGDWLDEDFNQDEEADLVTYESWYNQEDQHDHGCLLPCIITERRAYEDGEVKRLSQIHVDDDDDQFGNGEEPEWNQKDGPHGGSAYPTRYTAKLLDSHEDNTSINHDCHIYTRFEYFYLDMPREGITFVNKPHSTDSWIDHAFRHPIGLPEDMVPQVWKDKTRTRRMRGRKKQEKVMTEEEKEEEEDYQDSLKRWNDAESRREKLEETEEKRSLGSRHSPRGDL
mmetsp:Transcript_9926/g.19585  ORF Transcript_9926/g.19585 Transcript_9926/m.19585 type:complete len:843 (+) Transcript_9926:186-2714(+)